MNRAEVVILAVIIVSAFICCVGILYTITNILTRCKNRVEDIIDEESEDLSVEDIRRYDRLDSVESQRDLSVDDIRLYSGVV